MYGVTADVPDDCFRLWLPLVGAALQRCGRSSLDCGALAPEVTALPSRAPSWIALVTLQKRVVGLTELALDRFVTRARNAVGLRGAVNVLVTSNTKLRGLNRRFRSKDQPTDVLSFPALPGQKPRYAGDIAISAEIAVHNARSLGHSAAEEIKILALHGILHLRGYDHESDQGQMARREEKLRRDLRLPVGLIERASQRGSRSRRRP